MPSDDRDDLLRILEAHGQQFLSSFESGVLPGKRKFPEQDASTERKRRKVEDSRSDDSEADEEWNGFSDSTTEEEEGIDDEEPISDTRSPNHPNVIVFSDPTSKAASSSKIVSRAQEKAFMSSKVSKLTANDVSQKARAEDSDDEDDDEMTNAQNDALLHRLVHTQILSGSLNTELDLTPAQRRKALAGRVMEIAGGAKLGKGESAVRAKEHNKNTKRIREGLLAKQKERRQKELEEAKNMGNYHPALKQLFGEDSSAKPKQKRERGLKMGVGSFAGGVLRLSQSEIASVAGHARPQGKKGARRR
ncbi:hypothetical protein NM688_g91 [Phlebia brevispora]|uniref:Uncharacterized protein n=1 Tax=Phlebia brevispora TaxID=194682 RepID=A0ACC1TG28_9APHY|nr:hypothetical protein NM688_g91 [Phlebia brevispora]